MAEKKKESFVVTDRRLFTADGELRKNLAEEQESAPAADSAAATHNNPPPPSESRASAPESKVETQPLGDEPPQPTAAEQKQQADAYRQSSAEMDQQVELNGHSAKDPLLAEKTKGNLTSKEQNFLQNALYELRMAYVEVTNAIARGPQQVPVAK
jgi:hypothetical protein